MKAASFLFEVFEAGVQAKDTAYRIKRASGMDTFKYAFYLF